MAYVAIARLLATALALAIQRARQDPVQGAGTKAMMADEQTTDNVGSNLSRFKQQPRSRTVRGCKGVLRVGRAKGLASKSQAKGQVASVVAQSLVTVAAG
jgi:hypothetical protein